MSDATYFDQSAVNLRLRPGFALRENDLQGVD